MQQFGLHNLVRLVRPHPSAAVSSPPVVLHVPDDAPFQMRIVFAWSIGLIIGGLDDAAGLAGVVLAGAEHHMQHSAGLAGLGPERAVQIIRFRRDDWRQKDSAGR